MVLGPVVVFRPGALGDTIVTADAFWALGQACVPSSIELVGNPAAGALLQQAGLVGRVTSFDAAEVANLFSPRPRLPARWQEASAAVVWLQSGDSVARAFRNAGVDRIIVA